MLTRAMSRDLKEPKPRRVRPTALTVPVTVGLVFGPLAAPARSLIGSI